MKRGQKVKGIGTHKGIYTVVSKPKKDTRGIMIVRVKQDTSGLVFDWYADEFVLWFKF